MLKVQGGPRPWQKIAIGTSAVLLASAVLWLGLTALAIYYYDRALESKDLPKIRVLLGYSALASYRSRQRGFTALHLAAANGDRRLLTQLLSKKVSIDARTNSGDTPLLSAARFGHSQEVLLLVSRGADVNVCDNLGDTPLRLCAAGGRTDCVKGLIQAGARIDQPNAYGQTALMAAADWGHASVVKLLISSGALKEYRDTDGATAADHAKSAGHIFLSIQIRQWSAAEP